VKKHPVPATVAEAVIARENGACAVCGLPLHTGHLHHRKPRGMGGSGLVNTVSNMIHIHESCHLKHVERNRQRSYDMGWLVNGHNNPSETPMRYMLNRWVLLSDDGQITTVEGKHDENV